MKYCLFVILSCLFFLPSYAQTGLKFDGDNDYVNLNSLAGLMDTVDAFTIDFWVKFDSNENTDYGVFFSSNAINNDNVFLIRVGNGGFDPVNGSAVVYVNDLGNNYISGSSNIGDNECHHIAFTYLNSVCSLYVDGVLEASANHTIHFSSTDKFSFGQEYDGGFNSESNFYNGSLDEFRIWNMAKPAGEINNLMTLVPVGIFPDLATRFSFEEGLVLGNNSSLTHCINQIDPSMNGIFHNFDLTGSESNYIQTGCATEDDISTLDTIVCHSPFISSSGNEYVESGFYSDTLFNGNSIMSVQNIALEIAMEDVDVNISALSTGELVSYDTLASFQWLSCENFIPLNGETTSSFSPNDAGFYALELTYNGCKDTTVCLQTKGIGLEENVLGLSIFPNPSAGEFKLNINNLKGDFGYRVISSLGKVIVNKNIETFPLEITISSKGYFIIEVYENVSKKSQQYPVVVY